LSRDYNHILILLTVIDAREPLLKFKIGQQN